jgi:hypothetical protein
MADYIRRDDALFALRKAERGGSMTALTRLERAYAEIREMPAADVAEVVRCRACIYRIDGRCFSRTSFLNSPAVEPDNFCSWGATE